MDPKNKYAKKDNKPSPTTAETQSFEARLRLVCDVIEAFRMVCCHSITESHVIATQQHIDRTLLSFHLLVPVTHHNMMVHLLKHMPMYMKHWGPVRCYWNFDLERFFSFANRAMKQRQNPAATLVEAWRSTFVSSTDPDNGLLSQFVLPGDNYYVNTLVWPAMKHGRPYTIERQDLEATMYRSDEFFYELKNAHEHYCKKHKKATLFTDWLALEATKRKLITNNVVQDETDLLVYQSALNCIGSKYLKSVTYKGVTYSCAEREIASRAARTTSTSSWFRIWGSFLNAEPYYKEEWYYGRINYFVTIDLTLESTLQLARVCIYRPEEPDRLTKEPKFSTAENNLCRSVKYIYVEHIDAPIALAPVLSASTSATRPNVFFALLVDSPSVVDFEI